jgi:hypothetical protein
MLGLKNQWKKLVLKGFENRKFNHVRSKNTIKWQKKKHVTNKEFFFLVQISRPWRLML